jgi:site-specific DNA-adenine methylase
LWYYYGAKLKLVNKYPKPKHHTIIEPFAGSAQYSLKYWENDIILIDKYDIIIRLWKWLQKCSKDDILKLPILELGQNVEDFNWDCDEAKWLVGFNIVMGAYEPRKMPTKWTTTERPFRQINKLKLIANSLDKIKHWKFILGEYNCVENVGATWFIDPPYMKGGSLYLHNNIDYQELGKWCKFRNGQTIVCGNDSDTWLDFIPIGNLSGVKHKTIESVWYNETT